jgi:hypothetical protein
MKPASLHVRGADKGQGTWNSQSVYLMSNSCCKCLGSSEAPEQQRQDAPKNLGSSSSAVKPASAPAAQQEVSVKPPPALVPAPVQALQPPAVQNHMMMQLRATEPNTPPPFDRKDYKYSHADSPDSSPQRKTPGPAVFSPPVPPRSATSTRPNHRIQYKTVTGHFFFLTCFQL